MDEIYEAIHDIRRRVAELIVQRLGDDDVNREIPRLERVSQLLRAAQTACWGVPDA